MAKCPRVPPRPDSIDLTIVNGSIPWKTPTNMADKIRDRKALSLKTMISRNNKTIPNVNTISGI
jgi:hypothetical protein